MLFPRKLPVVDTSRKFYDLVAPLPDQWIASYSGGKDSTSLVTWVEWLRRTSQIDAPTPMLVRSDTEVEYPFLNDVCEEMESVLTKSGWKCKKVHPELREKLFNQIFGRGLPPVHPAFRQFRWCTRSTKVDPMTRFRKETGDRFFLSGVRWGESTKRDGKLKVAGCSAGGECGTAINGEDVYSPIINWTTCQVFDWLSGLVSKEVTSVMGDVLKVTRKLVGIYKPTELHGKQLRFGCIGCPALTDDKIMSTSPQYRGLRGIYRIWSEIRAPEHRLCKFLHGEIKRGPIRMESRKLFFGQFLDIQKSTGVRLVTDEDVVFIHDCWDRGVYPRGWSADDEITADENHRLRVGGLFRK